MAIRPLHSRRFWVVADAALLSMSFPIARVEGQGRPAAVGNGVFTATGPAAVLS
jgi:hypothetical protein